MKYIYLVLTWLCMTAAMGFSIGSMTVANPWPLSFATIAAAALTVAFGFLHTDRMYFG